MKTTTERFTEHDFKDVRKDKGLVTKILDTNSSDIKSSEFKEFVKSSNFKINTDMKVKLFKDVSRVINNKLGLEPYPVQIIAGIELSKGKIAQMNTGEGKTLSLVFPVIEKALQGNKVHVVTANDYLSERDFTELKDVYTEFGLTSAVIKSDSNREDRQAAYQADIVYSTATELGFDYLRDHMVSDSVDTVQQSHDAVFIDEADHILIDEALTPLILAGVPTETSDIYTKVNYFTKTLTYADDRASEDNKSKADVIVDLAKMSATLTPLGDDKAKIFFTIDNLYTEDNLELTHYLDASLKAHGLYSRGKDYIMKNNEVLLIEQSTGRVADGRRLTNGLMQAIEAKENAKVNADSITYAKISLQNYFKLYKFISGTTGTAYSSKDEFYKIYGLETVRIPTNKENKRIDNPDRLFLTKADKDKAIIEDIKVRHAQKQPILIGTASVKDSERLSKVLSKEKLPNVVLNAKQDKHEANIIEKAGQPGAITITTNMAGRGTDIKVNPDCFTNENENYRGLFVLSTERNDARRIDNQLRGRTGRQGEIGQSQFYLSLEDTLLKKYGTDKVIDFYNKNKSESSTTELTSGPLMKQVERSQNRIEGTNFDSRKNVLSYDSAVEPYRNAFYNYREYVVSDSFKAEKEFVKMANYLQNESFVKEIDDKLNGIDNNIVQTIVKFIILKNFDKNYAVFLSELDAVQNLISSQSYAQKTPLAEYQLEAKRLNDNFMKNSINDVISDVLEFSFTENTITNMDQASLVVNSKAFNETKRKLKVG